MSNFSTTTKVSSIWYSLQQLTGLLSFVSILSILIFYIKSMCHSYKLKKHINNHRRPLCIKINLFLPILFWIFNILTCLIYLLFNNNIIFNNMKIQCIISVQISFIMYFLSKYILHIILMGT